ncbi:MAG: hypothetical protein AB8H86_08045 [Polyangiales bacterium]
MRWIFCVALLSLGCRASLGECNDLELPIVFQTDAAGAVPMYAGQALMVQSCGAGDSICHSANATGPGRRAVPIGFDFDVRPLDRTVCGENTNTADCLEEQARLRTAVQIAFDYRVLSWNEVAQERMPPGGAEPVDPGAARYFSRIANNEGVPGEELAGLDTEEGKELFRNWVACGMPVVGQQGAPSSTTTPGDNCDPTGENEGAYGQCRVAGAPPMPPDPNWNSIYSYLRRDCASSICHGGDAEPIMGEDAMVAYDLIVGGPSSDDQACGDRTLIVPNDVNASLLYEKLAASEEFPPSCGDEMPRGAPAPPDSFLAPIREWINAGANP